MKRIVFDVESVGLHGEGFAVGWVVLDGASIVSEGYAGCESGRARAGTEPDRAWIKANVDPHLPPPTHSTPWNVCEAFWEVWKAAKAEGPVELWADCPWPVEARFLNACIDQDRDARNWDGPYPLLDVGVMKRAAMLVGMSAVRLSLPDELPAHNPLNDARQSARVLLESEAHLLGVRA